MKVIFVADKLDQQDQQINNSFRDLNILINQAKDMVTLSNSLISKLAAKTAASASATTNDEETEDMNKLKGYFANMGIIDNPVTKGNI